MTTADIKDRRIAAAIDRLEAAERVIVADRPVPFNTVLKDGRDLTTAEIELVMRKAYQALFCLRGDAVVTTTHEKAPARPPHLLKQDLAGRGPESGRRGSNPRHPAWKEYALAESATPPAAIHRQPQRLIALTIEQRVAVVPLTRGAFALIDPDDYPLVAARRWSLFVQPRTKLRYARTHPSVGMHRVITDAPHDKVVDHANNDGLDNRRCNLRVCTYSQNNANRRSWGKHSRFKGVSRLEGKWRAFIKLDGAQRELGRFDAENAAARAYDTAAIEHHGRFARLNFPQEGAA